MKSPRKEIPQLAGVIATLVEAAQPEKIILFGSYARGEARPDSDIDLLVIEEDVASRRAEMVRLDRAISQYRLPVEVIVVSADEVRKYGNLPGHLLYPALREGEVLYDRDGR